MSDNLLNNGKNSQKKSITSVLQAVLYISICIVGFYIIILLYINLLVKEKDKSFRNILRQIKNLLGSITTQLSFLFISIFFGLIISLPLVYFAQNKGNLFANIILLILAALIIWFYVKRIIKSFNQEKRISKAVSSLFPKWFRFVFWILFTIYLVPLSIGLARKNIFIAIVFILGIAFIINILFYFDKVIDYIKARKQLK